MRTAIARATGAPHDPDPLDPSGKRPRRWRKWAYLGAVAVVVAGVLTVVDPDSPDADRGDLAASSGPVKPNPRTPGNFHGYGFDQCLAPSQAAMDAWLRASPFQAVGIYISGDSRACRNQPNLTPTWIRTQLKKGWRLLPITLGPQASCSPRFPRYRDDFTINPNPGAGNRYKKARTQGRVNAVETVADATALGLTPGSTLWYDMEGFNAKNTHCRESALAFMSGWSAKVSELGFVAGVYSSAGSGIAELDKARIAGRKDLTLPKRIWVARWDGVANTSTSYIAEDGWRPGHRIKQFTGGHNEKWGGVTINIDRNRLELGPTKAAGENHCSGTSISFRTYKPIVPPATGKGPRSVAVRALKCLLKERGLYRGVVNYYFTPKLLTAIRAWHTQRGFTQLDRWTRRDWMSVLTWGRRPIIKFGTAGPYVRRIQRGLNAADLGTDVAINGRFDEATHALVKTYQSRLGLTPNGIVTGTVWNRIRNGKRAG